MQHKLRGPATDPQGSFRPRAFYRVSLLYIRTVKTSVKLKIATARVPHNRETFHNFGMLC